MNPNEVTGEAGRIYTEDLRRRAAGGGRRSRARTRSDRRRGLGEQLEAIRKRLELRHPRRSPLSQIQMGRYTGARV